MAIKQIQRAFELFAFHSAFRSHWDADFSFMGESHNFWELVYVVSGVVEVTEDAQVYRLSEGNLLLHAPMEFHKICSAEGTCPQVMITSFSVIGALPTHLTQGVFTLSEGERQEFTGLFNRIHHFFLSEHSEPCLGQECADCLSAFLIRLSENHATREQLSTSRDTKLYSTLVDTMTRNVRSNLSLEDIAEQCLISVSYMKVLFNRYAGISPKAYFSRLRCTEATKLLQAGFSASEVADIMHFSSVNYFSVFFKRMTGIPPMAFLRQNSSTPR